MLRLRTPDVSMLGTSVKVGTAFLYNSNAVAGEIPIKYFYQDKWH